MRSFSGRLAVLLLLLAIVLPSIGPLLDHHFAERHPGHRHVGLSHRHVHEFDQAHVHTYPAPSGAGAVALIDHESWPTAPSVVVVDDKALQAFLLFEPTTLLSVPTLHGTLVEQSHPVPLEKPPQLVS